MDPTEAAKQGHEVKGHIPAVDVDLNTMTPGPAKLIPWQEAAFHGKGPVSKQRKNPDRWASTVVPQAMVDRMMSGLPEPVRRTPVERYESLVRRLIETARATHIMFGHLKWPASVQRVLDDLGVKHTASERDQIVALAKHYISKAENQQRHKDKKKVVLDWHGHFS
jgi:hypothetical protein